MLVESSLVLEIVVPVTVVMKMLALRVPLSVVSEGAKDKWC